MVLFLSTHLLCSLLTYAFLSTALPSQHSPKLDDLSVPFPLQSQRQHTACTASQNRESYGGRRRNYGSVWGKKRKTWECQLTVCEWEKVCCNFSIAHCVMIDNVKSVCWSSNSILAVGMQESFIWDRFVPINNDWMYAPVSFIKAPLCHCYQFQI